MLDATIRSHYHYAQRLHLLTVGHSTNIIGRIKASLACGSFACCGAFRSFACRRRSRNAYRYGKFAQAIPAAELPQIASLQNESSSKKSQDMCKQISHKAYISVWLSLTTQSFMTILVSSHLRPLSRKNTRLQTLSLSRNSCLLISAKSSLRSSIR